MLLLIISGICLLGLGAFYIHEILHQKIGSDTTIIKTKVNDKKIDLVNFSLNEHISHEGSIVHQMFFIKTDETDEFIPVEEKEFNSYFINEPVDLTIKTDYYINYNFFAEDYITEEKKYELNRSFYEPSHKV